MIHTNRCKHCGKTKEEHNRLGGLPPTWLCKGIMKTFSDSGLAALDAHKEELYERALIAVKLWRDDNEKTMMNIDGVMFNLESIINQIEKEK